MSLYIPTTAPVGNYDEVLHQNARRRCCERPISRLEFGKAMLHWFPANHIGRAGGCGWADKKSPIVCLKRVARVICFGGLEFG